MHPGFEQLCDKHFTELFDLARTVVENELETTDSEEIYRRRRAFRYLQLGIGDGLSEDDAVNHMDAYRAARSNTTLDERQWLSRAAANQTRQSYVYFARHGDRIKIGTSVDVKERIRDLSLAPEALLAVEPGGRKRERELHDYFRPVHAYGEWFWAVPALLTYIEDVKKRHPIKEQSK